MAVGLTKPTLKTKPLDQVRKDVPTAEVQDSGDLVRVNLQVDKDTRKMWRAEALRRDVSMSELIRDAMSSYING
jgi:hypothetical protein